MAGRSTAGRGDRDVFEVDVAFDCSSFEEDNGNRMWFIVRGGDRTLRPRSTKTVSLITNQTWFEVDV
jgi:hypothetical protein